MTAGGSIEKLFVLLIAPRQLPRFIELIYEEFYCLTLDRSLIAGSIVRRCILKLDSSSIHLDRLSFIRFLYICMLRFLISLLRSLLTISHLFHSQTLSTQPLHLSYSFLDSLLAFSYNLFFYLSSYMFMHSDLDFGIFKKIWRFSKLMKFCCNFWGGLCLCDFSDCFFLPLSLFCLR